MRTMLDTAQTAIRSAAVKLGYDEQTIAHLFAAEAEHIFEIKLKSGKKFPAYRVQHNSKLGPYKGGIRFHPQVSLDEVRALATLMSLKTAAVGLPLGGGKGGIAVDPKQLSLSELEELSRAYAQQLSPHIGSAKDIPAPDVNTSAQVIDWMVDELAKESEDEARATFTGKSIKAGGSEGRAAATGRGGVIALIELLSYLKKADQPLTVALQGFGNVGYFFAEVLRDYPHITLVAVSNSKQTLYKADGMMVTDHTSTKGTPALDELNDASDAEKLPSDAIFGIKADILVLAALENAITMQNVEHVQASIIVELANGPVDSAAYDALTKRGVLVLPDILANAGGVIVSYLEWQQNKQKEHWSEEEVNEKLQYYMQKASRAILARYDAKKTDLKAATFEYALQKLVET